MPPSEGRSSALGRAWVDRSWREWRLPPIETYPSVVAFAQTRAGRFLLFAGFAGLMKLVGGGTWPRGVWLELTVAAAVVSLAGPYRRHAALAAIAALLASIPFDFGAVYVSIWQETGVAAIHPGYLRAGALIAWLVLAAVAIHLARRYRDHPVGGRPVLLLHVLCLGLLGLATSHVLRGLPQVLLWGIVAVFLAFFWFLAFALMEQRSRTPTPLLSQFASFYPFFGLTTVPWGKGSDNWRSLDAATAEELAVTQIKGLKLLAWAFFLTVVLWVFRRVVYGKLGITPLGAAFERFLQGNVAPAPSDLLSIIANFPEQLLVMAIWGHAIVATARLAGLRLLRNTCRPLSSRTIAEFWNRYFYYFKEMLVNVYFYPTYLRCFKRHPRLRIAFATFMAAGVGNFFFHFLLDNRAIAEFGLLGALVRFQTYAFYCAVLVTGIVLSQLRTRRPDASAGWLRARFLPVLGVMMFYCFLSFFDGPQRHVGLGLHFAFLFHVFGVERWIQAIG